MEEPSNVPDQLSATSAASLQALEKRAKEAARLRREQMAQLEAAITERFEQISSAVEGQAAGRAAEAEAELEQLRGELQSAQSSAAAERAAMVAERDELRALVANLESIRDELTQKLSANDAEQTALAEQWAAERDALQRAADDLKQEIARLESERNGAPSDADVKRLEDELATLKSAAEDERAALEAARAEAEAELTKANAQREKLEQAWATERQAILAQRDASAERLATLEAEHQSSETDGQSQLAELEQKLAEQQSARQSERDAWDTARRELEHERDESHQKFELALADVQRLRERVAELEQDVASRPQPTAEDSAELVALRAERDALSEQLAELQRQPATGTDSETEQQMADLQRRFEMAVEDVRELKTKNAKLEAQLAASKSTSGAAPESGGMDWESQKRRLLASLEVGGDEEDDDPERQEERLSIQNTIDMTDAVVAEKDREIAELKAQLAAADAKPATPEDTRDAQIQELVDADEVIAAHRQRIAEVEHEMQEKLRAAELELSVERAKLARQKAELEDLRAELDKERAALEASGGLPPPGAPRRRWLSKLGLTGDEAQ